MGMTLKTSAGYLVMPFGAPFSASYPSCFPCHQVSRVEYLPAPVEKLGLVGKGNEVTKRIDELHNPVVEKR